METNGEIASFMRDVLDDYKQIKGKSKNSCSKPFWDVVVITTADIAQREAFQTQIDEKFRRKELPIDLTIHIVSDPPGVRIGNGGSTLNALEFLEAHYGAEIYQQKTLLIHAGGWSQRMPSASILGKIFSVLPHGNPPYQMLDLKLALYWPLVDKIEPGVFITCADDFVVYSFGSSKDWKIPAKGFTALAHPSPLSVGKTHGVYVVKDMENINTSCHVNIRECLEVLQKPTEERMKSQGALLKGESHEFADGIHIEGEAVYTDSSFYFGTDVMKKLILFKKSVGNLSCEIDAYGDFLQALGVNATSSYIHLTSNISQVTSNLIQMRQNVFDVLKDSDIHLLILNASSFIHIGTTKELLYHFCHDKVFQSQMSFEKEVFNSWVTNGKDTTSDSQQIGDTLATERDEGKVSPTSCIIHSAINNQSLVSEDCVLEFCDFELPLEIMPKCIVSNCQVSLSEAKEKEKLVVPEGTFLHTVPVILNGHTEFVTVFFHIEDNLKKSASLDSMETLPFLGSDVGHYMKAQGYAREDILPQSSSGKTSIITSDVTGNADKSSENKITCRPSNQKKPDSDKVSLWNLKLYPSRPTMTASVEEALFMLSMKNDKTKAQKMAVNLFSFANLLDLKDVSTMIQFRKILFEKIIQ